MSLPVANIRQNKVFAPLTRMYANAAGNFIHNVAPMVVDVDTETGNFMDVQGGFGSKTDPQGMGIGYSQLYPRSIHMEIQEVTGWTVQLSGLGADFNIVREQLLDNEAIRLMRPRLALLMQQCMIERERTFASLCFTAGNWTGYTTDVSSADPTEQFQTDTADPVEYIQSKMDTVELACGRRPNAAIIGHTAWQKLRTNERFRSYRKFVQDVNMPFTEAEVASFFGLDQIFVGRAVENTAQQGATESKSRIWGAHMLLFRRDAALEPETPQGTLHRYRARGFSDGTPRTEQKSDLVRQLQCLYYDQFLATNKATGHLLRNIAA